MIAGNVRRDNQRPRALSAGDRVALIAPAGPVTEERIAAAIAHCELLHLEPVVGPAARTRVGYLAGDDAARLSDLVHAFADDSIRMVWALRGGYGTMRLLPDLPLPRTPRIYLGFSDNTAVHLRLLADGHVSFHGPHPGAELPPLALECLRRVLFEPVPAGALPADAAQAPIPLRSGVASGELMGGNLALVAALCGTRWQPSARGRIVFLEDVGEPGYRVDRMLRQLELCGVMAGVAGLALGRFTECGTDEDRAQVEGVLREFAARCGVPAVMSLPIGHVAENWTIPLGIRAELNADAGTLSLIEAAVEPV